MTFHSSVCRPNLSPLCVFVAPVRSSCCVKQAVNQPDPYKTTLLRHQQVSRSTFVILCHSVLLAATLHFPSTRLLVFTRQPRRASSDIYRPEVS